MRPHHKLRNALAIGFSILACWAVVVLAVMLLSTFGHSQSQNFPAPAPIAINEQTGTSYTISSKDFAKLVTLSNVGAVAVTLPQCGVVGINQGWYFDVENVNSGLVTITPTTSTIDGSATLALSQNQGARLVCNSAGNYASLRGFGNPFGSATGTLNQIPKGTGAGQLGDSVGLSESYPTFTVNESQTTNGTQSVIGDIKTTQLTAPSGLSCVQGATTGGFLLHNQAYFYKVTAISANGETTVSGESTFTSAASPVPDTYTANCSWTGHSGDTGYKIYRSTTTGTELFLATVTPGNTNSYTDNTNTTPSGAMPTANNTGSASLAGLIPTYNLLATSGNGVASVQAAPTVVTIGSGANIASTSLCSTTLCPAGDYQVNVFIDITTACTTTGTYIPWLGWTDDQGAKTGSSTTTYFSAAGGLGVTPATVSAGATLGLATTANFMAGTFYLHTTGAATNAQGSINYGATATACGTGGPMVGKMYFTVIRLR